MTVKEIYAIKPDESRANALLEPELDFDGATYDVSRDFIRLKTQFDKVKALMMDGTWKTLAQIQRIVGGSEAGVSARLRDLRKAKFGGFNIERRRKNGGLWEYHMGHKSNE